MKVVLGAPTNKLSINTKMNICLRGHMPLAAGFSLRVIKTELLSWRGVWGTHSEARRLFAYKILHLSAGYSTEKLLGSSICKSKHLIMKKLTWRYITASWPRLFLVAVILLAAGCDSASPIGSCVDPHGWLVEDLIVGAEIRTDSEVEQTDQLYVLTLKVVLQRPSGVARAAPRGGRPSLSLFPRAYALSCPSPTTEDEILWINITSNNDFDQDYLAGQELQDIALISNDRWSPRSYEPLTGPDARESWPLTGLVYSPQYYLLFDRQPTLDTEHTFNLQVMLASGAYFEVASPPISFSQETASP